MEKPALNDSMMDLILSSENMHKAWKQVKRNGGSPGVDGMTIEKFPEYLQTRWVKIKQALLLGYYVPSPVLRVEIPKKIRWTEQSFQNFHYQLKYLTRRSWGVSMEYRLNKLNQYIRGWMNYYGISQYYRPLQQTQVCPMNG